MNFIGPGHCTDMEQKDGFCPKDFAILVCLIVFTGIKLELQKVSYRSSVKMLNYILKGSF